MPSRGDSTDCYLGLDLGTSGCRVTAIDRDGLTRAEARASLPDARRPEPGASEQDPEDWWHAACSVLSRVAAQQPGRIRALCVDATSSTLLLCDRQGVPCTPALMYDDSRARAEAELIAAVAPDDCAARGPGSALAKLLYLLARCADREPAHAVHQADWINGRLSGTFGLSDENNALKLGYDPIARTWPAWLHRLPVPPQLLPRVCPVGTPIGRLTDTVAGRLGLPNDIVLVAGTTDSNAATLAAGVTEPGDAVTSLGSTLVLKVLSEQPLFASRYGIYSHRIGDHWLVGGASNAGGRVLRQHFSDSEMATLSRQIDPDHPLGLDYYPLPGIGERFPYHDPQMAPRLSPRLTRRSAFLQAILEGLADIEAQGYQRLAELGAPYPTRVFTSGGGSVNEAWRRIRERRLGVPVFRAVHTEAAYGAAQLARAAFTQQAAPGVA